MVIRKIPFVLCVIAALLMVSITANAAFPGPGLIPEPPGHGDNPDPAGNGDNPAPPGPGDNPGDHPDGPGDNPNPPGHGDHPGDVPPTNVPPNDPIIGLENALEQIGQENAGKAYDVISYLYGLDELPPAYPPGLGQDPPGPADFSSTGFGLPLVGTSSDPASYAVTPEPATLGLLVLGGLALLKRRR